MISVEEALEKVLSYVDVLEREEKPILECLGQVSDEDIYSPIDVPPLANAAMDGFAVRSKSTQGASKDSPRILRVIGEVAAGCVSEQEVEPGTAIRIMTGAPIPKGADSVVPFEDTDETERKALGKTFSEVGVLCEVSKGLNIRGAGEDITAGALVLKKRTVLHPPEIGALASIGRGRAVVIRRPVVAILATGSELVDIDLPLSPGKIYNSNTYSLAAQVKQCGGIPKILGSAPDSEEMLADKIRQGLDSDMLITSGGVSRGDYDMVKDVLAREGEVAFWTVRMKPGKPLAFGVLGKGKKVPHLGLPGNPVSAMITFELFARPAILKMMGKPNLAKPTIEAVLESPIENRDSRRIFARAVVTKREDRYFARLTGPQGSGILTSMAQANGLVIVPENVTKVEEGELVQVLMLDWDKEN